MIAGSEIRPNPGPQEAFLATDADIAIFGGSAGGGKSLSLALEAARYGCRKGYGGIIFRREATRLVGSGSIWEEASGIYPGLGATSRLSPILEWRWPSGGIVEMRHLQHEADKLSHSGKQYAFVGFDELTEFAESQFWFLLSRLRTTCGIRPYVRATCNPDPDSFVRTLIDWYIDENGFAIPSRCGVIRWFVRDDDELIWGDSRAELEERFPDVDERGERLMQPLSFTFIAASLADNPKGDPTYRSKLQALPRVERERLLGGNWNIRPAAGLYFRRDMFGVLEMPPHESSVRRYVRAWDKAATAKTGSNDPDWTVGVKLAEMRDGRYVVVHVVRLRGAPAEVERVIRATAELDGIDTEVATWQDPGQAGVVDVDRMREVLKGYRLTVHRAAKDKLTYAGVWQSQAEGGRVSIVRGPWNEAYLATLEAFPEGRHDDDVDATSLAFQVAFGGTSIDDWLRAMEAPL